MCRFSPVCPAQADMRYVYDTIVALNTANNQLQYPPCHALSSSNGAHPLRYLPATAPDLHPAWHFRRQDASVNRTLPSTSLNM